MTIGLSQFRDARVERLDWMLALPFVGQVGDYPVNRAEGSRSQAPEVRGLAGTRERQGV